MMLSLRLVLDTNIVGSAALKAESISRTALLLALAKPSYCYVSPQILQEYEAVLARAELRIPRARRLKLIQFIRNRVRIVTPKYSLDIARDPDDNIFLECADMARADYLITGNKRHFPAFWKSTKVISAPEFLTIVAPHLLS